MSPKKRKLFGGFLLFILLLVFFGKKIILKTFFAPTKSPVPTGVSINSQTNTPPPETTKPQETTKEDIKIIAENLKIPWELVFLPNGDMLITERPGNLLKIGSDKNIIKIDGVTQIGEGGLLGMALDPEFNDNNYIYLYSTTREDGQYTNRVERYKLLGSALSDRKVIVSGIKGAANHDGGRIRFGPDKFLYVTTGDAQTPSLAQDKNSLNGKVLKVDRDGIPASDNPFDNAVYSMGHRNVQGIAWDQDGTLWATEHGPSGSQTGNDEVNLIQKGGNYGWPVIKGTQTAAGMISPIIESGRSDTWAPSGMVYFKKNLFFGGLRGEALYQAKIDSDNNLTLTANFKKEFGRIRTVTIGPEGYFYILTNNTDGRGTPNAGDDKVIRVNPDLFLK